MFELLSILCLWQRRRGRYAPAHWRTPWRAVVALCTALAFTFVLATAASHHHKSNLESQTCAVCSVLADKLADLPRPPAIPLVLVLLAYRIEMTVSYACLYQSPRILPPSCGPPRLF